MDDSPLWLSASLACLLVLALLACAACLFLIRRVARLSRSERLTEQRMIQLALDFRRLEQRVRKTKSPQREPGPAAGASEAAPSLISIPDMGRQVEGKPGDETSLAQKHGEVWAMAERGLGAAEIAQTTGRPIGQVELIIGLHRRHHALKSAKDHAKRI